MNAFTMRGCGFYEGGNCDWNITFLRQLREIYLLTSIYHDPFDLISMISIGVGRTKRLPLHRSGYPYIIYHSGEIYIVPRPPAMCHVNTPLCQTSAEGLRLPPVSLLARSLSLNIIRLSIKRVGRLFSHSVQHSGTCLRLI